jgi:4-hydroxyproline epimerase
MSSPLQETSSIRVIDSHTAGEPTRTVIAGGPHLGSGSVREKLERCHEHLDRLRRAVVSEPRGSDVVVGALLCEPLDPGTAAAGIIFFNDVGFLGMCGHGTIGVVTTLAYLGKIQVGSYKIETPVGMVDTELHADGSVSVENVPSYRYRKAVSVTVPGYGTVTGDIAWGGNWFFLVEGHELALGLALEPAHRAALVAMTSATRQALAAAGITGEGGALIDHIEVTAPPRNPANSARNFVLCPGASFDRSPCGTGTSAKVACLAADGALRPGEIWRQEGILDTVFTATYEPVEAGRVRPTITGRAWITAESTLLFDAADPFREGIRF